MLGIPLTYLALISAIAMSASAILKAPVKVVLGTMSYGGQTPKAVAMQQLEHFVSIGHNNVDTARMYVHGQTEQLLGEILQESPMLQQTLVIDSKVNAFPDYDKSLHPDNVLLQFEKILHSLQTNAINVLYLHAPGKILVLPIFLSHMVIR